MSESWLQNLKAGDSVIVSDGRVYMPDRIVCVTRVTRTQIVVSDIRYNRDTGYERGGSTWGAKFLVEPTQERLAEIRERHKRQRLITALKNMVYDKVSTDTLMAIVVVLQNEDGACTTS